MNCIITGYNISNDKDNRLRKIVEKVALENQDATVELLTYFHEESNNKYKQFVFDNLTDEIKSKYSIKEINDLSNEKLADINQNILEGITRRYFISNARDIKFTDAKRENQILDGFLTASAKNLAKEYTASLILQSYYNNLTSDTESNLSSIKKDIIKIVKTEFRNIIGKSLIESLKEGGTNYNIANKSDIEDAKKLSDIDKKLIAITKQLKDKSIPTKFYNELIRNKKELIAEYNLLMGNLIESLPNYYTRYKNYYAFYNQLINNTDNWIDEAKSTRKLISLYKLFNGTNKGIEETEGTKQNNFIEEDDIDIEIDENYENIDLSTKSWINKLLKSFDQNIEDDVKIKLSFVEKLIKNNKGEYIRDTNNELGVTTYLDPQYVITQISNGGDFSSINNFIESINKLAENRPELAGLNQLYNEMKENRLLANRLKTELGSYTIIKIQTIIQNNIINCRISNANSKSQSVMVFALANNAASTFKEAFNSEHIETLNNITINNSLNQNVHIDNNEINAIKTILIPIFNEYFPSIKKEDLTRYFESSYGTKENTRAFINNLVSFIGIVGNQKDLYNTAITNNKINYNTNAKRIEAGLEEIKHENELDNLDILGAFLNVNLINIATELEKVITPSVSLNSFNAEGNMASDLIANSKITNLMRQIMYEGESGTDGLQKLLEFVTKNTMYQGNTFLFGVTDENGNVIEKGLFRKNAVGNGYSINENAKNMIRVALYDGTENRELKEGVLYDTMSSSDYFVTMMRYYNNKNKTGEIVNENIIKFYDGFDAVAANGKTSMAGYFMRTPSDAPKNFVVFMRKYAYTGLINPSGNINHKNSIYLALRQILLNEIREYVRNLDLINTDNLNNLYRNYHFIENKDSSEFINNILDENKKRLSGNVFKFKKLFKLDNFDINEFLHTELSLYGDNANSLININSSGTKFTINKQNVNWLIDGNFVESNKVLQDIVARATDEWIKNYVQEIDAKSAKYLQNLDGDYTTNDIREAALNHVIAYNNYDALFEGDTKFYKNEDDFVKRTKEAQASGKQSSAFDLSQSICSGIIEGEDIGAYVGLSRNRVIASNIFKAITVKNIIKDCANIDNIEQELYNIIYSQTNDKEFAEKQSKFIAKKYTNVAVDNAQSYITFEEWVRRRYNDGTLNQYSKVIQTIDNLLPYKFVYELNNKFIEQEEFDKLDKKEQSKYRKVTEYNPSILKDEDINKFIQVQKNFYYDIFFDSQSGVYVPRQIKNAEFVLIPQLLPANSQLRKLYEIMKENGIDQVNNDETDKSGRKISLKLWNDDGTINDNFNIKVKESNAVQPYYYQYLYKQQDFPSHLKDEENRAGLQILKKIADNVTKETEPFVNAVLEAYSDNIRLSYNTFLDDMGWYEDEEGVIRNKSDNSDNLDFSKFYELALKEGSRLGLDANYHDYFETDEDGQTRMPTFMNSKSVKAESIAQSLFNSHITNQKLPGWHAIQVSGVGFKKRNGEALQYHPAKEDGSGNEVYVEIAIPRTSLKIPKYITDENGNKRKFQPEDLPEDAQYGIMYRIPTEGKQSATIYKIVEFLDDVYDSTVAIADGWLGQTGSDEDGDSVYGISYELYKDKEGNLQIANREGKEHNNKTILDNMRKIFESNDAREENYLSSNYEQITEQIKHIEKHFISSYNPFDSIDKMENAMSGARLKGMSVVRDGFNSVANKGKAVLSEKNTITILYDANKYNIDVLKERYNIKNEKGEYIEENVKEITIDENSNINLFPLSQKEKTATHGVIIDTELKKNYIEWQKNNPNGIVAYRINFNNYNSINEVKLGHIGNPFSENERGSNTVEQFYNWIITGNNYGNNKATKEFRHAIIEKIKSINIPNVLYYKELNRPSHATVIGYLIEHKELLNNTKNSSNTSGKKYIQVKHNKWAWSNDNRNIDGHLVTAYSSQTTAHILDAIKVGTLKNENEYTFPVFKTLVDIGTNYETAINFLIQPGISLINNYYFASKSIYNKENDYIIPNAEKDIANKLGLKLRNKPINNYSSLREVKELINKNDEIKGIIKDLYGFEISDIFAENYPINTDILKERLSHDENSMDKRDLVIDLISIIQFDKINKTTKKIESIANCTRTDRFGAKQTIMETRQIVNDIERLRKFDDTILINNEPLLEALYGENSFYPYLKAFLNYSTIPSVNINSQLFDLENDTYNRLYDILKNSLGRDLTEEEYKNYKQYLVADTYRYLKVLNTPLLVDKFGVIISNTKLINEYSENTNNASPIEGEMRRICGINTPDTTNFKIANWNTPTEQEIYEFSKLTPAQKVIQIQKHFDNAELFDYLDARTIDATTLRYKGYTVNRIIFNDGGNSIDDLIYQHRAAFFNHNPLIKLAAIDLIKYAFIVEGFKFKYNGITKIISNDSLFNFAINGEGSIISDLRKYITEGVKNKTIEKFIRANDNVVQSTYIKEDLLTALNKHINKNTQLITIPLTNENVTLLRALKYNPKHPISYIKIIRGKGKNKYSTLYTIEYREDKMYLYPLNLLEYNETNDVSINNKNNKYRNSDFYRALIDALDRGIVEGSSEYKEIEKELFDKIAIDKQVFEVGTKKLDEYTGLQNLAENGDNLIGEQAKTLISRINAKLDKDGDAINSRHIFLYGKGEIAKYISRTPTTQVINNNEGNPIAIRINNAKLSPISYKYIYNHITFDEESAKEKLPIYEYDTVKELYTHNYIGRVDKKVSINIPIYYFTVLDNNIVQELIAARDEKAWREELEGTEPSIEEELELEYNDDFDEAESMASSTDISDINIPTVIEPSVEGGFIKSFEIAKVIVDDILKHGKSEFEKEINDFNHRLNRQAINKNNIDSLENNKKFIIRAASQFYSTISFRINNDLNDFVTSAGNHYSINDEKLYKELINSDDTDYNRLIRLLLNAKTFGDKLSSVIDLTLVDEDKDIQEDLNNIKKSIEKIKNNPKIKTAINHFYNIYFAQKYSNNPNIKSGLSLLTETFGDTDKMDFLFSDVAELDHKLVQAVSNYLASKVHTAEMVDAKEAVKKYRAKIKDIIGEDTELFKKVIKNGKLVQDYQPKLFEDKRKKQEQLDITEIKYGKNSKEYFLAKLDFDKFINDHFYQPVKRKYYTDDIAIRQEVINAAGDLFFEYDKLVKSKYDEADKLIDSDVEQQRLNDLGLKIRQLLNKYDANGNLKSKEELAKIKAIKNYKAKLKVNKAKYYETIATNDFEDKLTYYEGILNKFNANHPNMLLEDKLKDNDYKEAYDWIKNNTIRMFSDDAQTEITKAFELMSSRPVGVADKLTRYLNTESNHIDRYGIVDGRTFTKEQIAAIKEEKSKSFAIDYESVEGDASLIKNIPVDRNVYFPIFYDMFNKKLSKEDKEKKAKLIRRINEILINGIDETGRINSKKLFDYYTDKDGNPKQELQELANAYKELKSIKGSKLTKDQTKAIKNNITFETDSSFEEERAYFKIIKDKRFRKLWTDIFVDQVFDENGGYVLPQDENGKTITRGNSNIFGYITVNNPENYLDEAKTKARKLIEEDIDYVPTEYYFDELKKHGVDSEWYKENHIYNPYTHTYEPLAIWTSMVPKAGGKFDNPENYGITPNDLYSTREIKADAIEKNYNPNTSNYIAGDPEYDAIPLQGKELELRNYLADVMRDIAIGTHYKQRVIEGFAPSRYKDTLNASYWLHQGLGVLGMTVDKREREFADHLSFVDDFDATFDMLEEIKTKGYQNIDYSQKPDRAKYINQDLYIKDLQEWNKKVDEIKKNNDKLASEVRSEDWYNIFQDFIERGTVYKEKAALKDTGYLLLEYLKDNPAYDINWRGNVKRGDGNLRDNPKYGTKEQTRTFDIVENYLKRLLFNQFKENHKLRPYAETLQNLASAKYMMFNITGGIANITTGLTNIMGETFAKQYVNNKAFAKAQREYIVNIPSILGSMYKEEASSEVAAILKYFNVVDFTEYTERRPDETVAEYTKRVRELFYSFQNGGEHYMQNSVLLAMLDEYRMWQDKTTGKWVVGNVNDYQRNLEEIALLNVINDNPDLYRAWISFKQQINIDKNELKKYDQYRKDAVSVFLKTKIDGAEKQQTIDKYLKIKEELIKNNTKNFYKLNTVRSGLHYNDNKVIELYENSSINEIIGEFKNRVISVNNKIHGVYNKIGAAYIEKFWYGGIVMQYHKHLYPGILKRWRVKGMFNENRNSIELGSYISVAKFLTTEFRELEFARDNEGEVQVIESIQNIFKAAIDTFANLKVNWQLMSEWEKANCRRVIGDICGITSGILLACAIYAMTDDDDLKESNFLATCLYLSDRLYQESNLYTPQGLMTEGKTMWSSPIASEKLIEDMFASMTIITNWMIDPDYSITYTNGIYNGENKLWVKLRRNIPIYRVYDRLGRMTVNNNYYRIGDNNRNLVMARWVADFVNPE